MSDYISKREQSMETPGHKVVLVQDREGAVNFEKKIDIRVGDRTVIKKYKKSKKKRKKKKRKSEKKESSESRSRRIMGTVNRNSWRKTPVKITGSWSHEDIKEPKCKVYPQMKKVKDFFKGRYVGQKGIVEKRGPKRRKMTSQYVNDEYINEFAFKLNPEQKPTVETAETLLKSFMEEKKLKADESTEVTALVAPAGGGKTTCMRRIARDVMEASNLTEENDFSPSDDSRFDYVHYIEVKNIENKESTNLGELLFGGQFSDPSDVQFAYKQLVENQSKIALFFDGLDQAPWVIDESNEVEIEHYTSASTATIMYNLLSRKLLPNAKIMVSSREFRVAMLPQEARPNTVVALTGLSRDDVKQLFIALLDDQGPKTWDKLVTSSSPLLRLISIPVFLILSAVLLRRNLDGPVPDSVTGLMAGILEVLQNAKNMLERKHIVKIINKLKALAHEGMKEKRVTFQIHDLEKLGLTVKDVRDLMIEVPGSNKLSQYFVADNFILFFCHQSIQEFLSACFVAELNYKKFKSFVRKHLHKDRWSVVRQFLCGIIQNKKVSLSEDLHIIHDKRKKRKVLQEALVSHLKSAEQHQMLELFAALNEANDTMLVKSNVRQIDLSNVALGTDGAHSVSAIMAKCDELDLIGLWHCGLNREVSRIVNENMRDRRLHVKTVNLADDQCGEFNAILSNLVIDKLEIQLFKFISEVKQLDWKNVRELELSYPEMVINNDGDLLHIKSDNCGLSGSFTKTEETLSVDSEGSNDFEILCLVCRIEKLCNPKNVSVTLKSDLAIQYLNQHELEQMKNWTVSGKTNNLLLRLYPTVPRLNPSSVVNTLQKLQVENLEVTAVLKVNQQDSKIFVQQDLMDIASQHGINFSATWCFDIEKPDDFKQLAEVVNQNKLESLRLYFWNTHVSQYLESFVSKCRLKSLVLVINTGLDHFSLSSPAGQSLLQAAKSQGTSLELCNWLDEEERVGDAWYVPDLEAFYS